MPQLWVLVTRPSRGGRALGKGRARGYLGDTLYVRIRVADLGGRRAWEHDFQENRYFSALRGLTISRALRARARENARPQRLRAWSACSEWRYLKSSQSCTRTREGFTDRGANTKGRPSPWPTLAPYILLYLYMRLLADERGRLHVTCTCTCHVVHVPLCVLNVRKTD